MTASIDLLRAFVWELRRTFRELAAASDQSLEPLGITVGDRAVLEFLSRESAAASLSQLARKHSVSRQHVQQALRRLPDQAWIETSIDPKDARTLTVRLSPDGWRFWDKVQATEEDYFGPLAQSADAEEIRRAAEFLRGLRSEIAHFRKLVRR